MNDSVPVYIPNYRSIQSQHDEINRQIQKLQQDDIIEPSVSPYNSPILLVPKKAEDQCKKWRLVVDFRQLNKKILADKFPLPRIDEILDQLGRAKYFTTLDLMSGFHQIPLDQESRKYTAFSTTTGHYQFKRLPFGLNISPNSFQRMMNIAMAGLTPEIAFIYIDDIVIIGCSENHHLKNLAEVFERLRYYNLKLNPSKCKFFQTEVVYLGHKITDKGILPDDSKFNTLLNYPTPKNADEVRRFVAFCNYYRKFVENFATIAHPLNQLLRKNTTFIWSNKCQQAFDHLRCTLMSPKILQYPDFNNKFILTTDASDIGCGAVLSQVTEEGDLPVAFASKTFTPGEKNKAVILKELTAIHWAINYFRPYLYGRRFTVRTDHRPLVYLFKIKDPTSKLTRMRLELEEFDFDIVYIRGKENVGADALSRIQITSEELKQNNILVVNTRAMTRRSKFVMDKPVINREPDQLHAYTTENPTETRNMLKLVTTSNNHYLTFIICKKNKHMKVIAQLQQSKHNGRQTLEFALANLENRTKNMKIEALAIANNDEIFKDYTMNEFKEKANKVLENLKIVIYNPQKIISDLEEIRNIIKAHHETPTGGHIGQKRLYLKLRETYVWRNMKNSIADFVKACELCKRNKIITHTREKLIITTTPSKPFEVVSIDTVGPLPRSNHNNRYALTLQCDLTKYVVLIPLETKEANSIARALVDNFILKHGNFLELKSDQGTEFKNEVLDQICKLLQIKQSFSTAYHPETIGSLERNHRCLNEYLRFFVNEHQTDWDNWMKYYEFSYNTTPHSDHGYTPFELVFGRKAILPQDLYNGIIEPIYNIESYKNELQFKIQKSNKLAREKLISQKLLRSQKSANTANPIEVKEGEIVYLSNENRRKLDAFYNGPYIVTKIQNQNCEILNEITNKSMIVHKNRLIK